MDNRNLLPFKPNIQFFSMLNPDPDMYIIGGNGFTNAPGSNYFVGVTSTTLLLQSFTLTINVLGVSTKSSSLDKPASLSAQITGYNSKTIPRGNNLRLDYTLNSEQITRLTLIDPGTYYWHVSYNLGGTQRTITKQFIVEKEADIQYLSLTKNFVLTKKSSYNYVTGELDYYNPKNQPLNLRALVRTEIHGSVLNAGNLLIQNLPKGSGTRSFNISCNMNTPNFSLMFEDDPRGLTLDIINAETEEILYTEEIFIKDVHLVFSNPSLNTIKVGWNSTGGDTINVPTLPGYTNVEWVHDKHLINPLIGGTNTNLFNMVDYINSSKFTSYEINFSGTNKVKRNNSIKVFSGLPGGSTATILMSPSDNYLIQTSSQQFNLLNMILDHYNSANLYEEYIINSWNINRTNHDGTPAPSVSSNILNIPANSSGDLSITVNWEFTKRGPGTIGMDSASISNIDYIINGVSETYNFNTYLNPTDLYVPISISVKPGYEFISNYGNIIYEEYPYESDGFIGIGAEGDSALWDNSFKTYHWINDPTFPVLSNKGTIGSFYYEFLIPKDFSGDLRLSLPTKASVYNVYVPLNPRIISFKYNGVTYNSNSTKEEYNGIYYVELPFQFQRGVNDNFTISLKDFKTDVGYYLADYNHVVTPNNFNSYEGIKNAMLVDLPNVSLQNFPINAIKGAGVKALLLDKSSYTFTTPSFTPKISSIGYYFGYGGNSYTVSGNAYDYYTNSLINPVPYTNFASVPFGSYYRYDYIISSTKNVYNITKPQVYPIGINSATLSMNNYSITNNNQLVNITYSFKEGYEADNTKQVSVGPFKDDNNITIGVINPEFNKFTIPAKTVGNVNVTFPEPKKVNYSINVGLLNGYESITINKNTYQIDENNNQTINLTYNMKEGYEVPTGNLVVTGLSKNPENINSDSFVIPKGSTGNISISVAPAGLTKYSITIDPDEGFKNLVQVDTEYTIETNTFTPVLSGFMTAYMPGYSGYNLYLDEERTIPGGLIEKGSTGNKTFYAKAKLIEYNIKVIKNTSVSRYSYNNILYLSPEETIDTFTMKDVENAPLEIRLYNILASNNLRTIEWEKIYEIGIGTTQDYVINLSADYKINNISLSALPEGIKSVSFSDETYTSSPSFSKVITLGITAKDGYRLSTDPLIIEGLLGIEATPVNATNIGMDSFTIPVSTYGDISITIPAPELIKYNIIYNKDIDGVPSNSIAIDPAYYTITDSFPKTFSISYETNEGYNPPAIKLNGTTTVYNSFSMNEFTTNIPILDFFTGGKINYDLKVNIDNSIISYTVGSTSYTTSAVVSTYTVTDNKKIQLTDVITTNSLYNEIPDQYIWDFSAGQTGNKEFNLFSTKRTNQNISIATPYKEGIESISLNINSYDVSSNVQNVSLNYVMKTGYRAPESNLSISGLRNINGSPRNPDSITSSSFRIPKDTYGNLLIETGNAIKETYSITSDLNTKQFSELIYRLNSVRIYNYQVSNLPRNIDVSYVMKGGYKEPTGNLTVSKGGAWDLASNNTFRIPANGIGNVMITPAVPEAILNTISVNYTNEAYANIILNREDYYVNHDGFYEITLDFIMKPGYSAPIGNLSIVGLKDSSGNPINATNITKNSFRIPNDAWGNLTITPAPYIINTYNIIKNANPDPNSINIWSVEPASYKVTDFNNGQSVVFTITAAPYLGYEQPVVKVNGDIYTLSTFTLTEFTETVPVFNILGSSLIEYSVTLKKNKGINSATILPSTYTIKDETFTPWIENGSVVYKNGYSDYVTDISPISIGSTGDIEFNIKGTPIEYTIDIVMADNANQDAFDKFEWIPYTYTVEDTPFSLMSDKINVNDFITLNKQGYVYPVEKYLHNEKVSTTLENLWLIDSGSVWYGDIKFIINSKEAQYESGAIHLKIPTWTSPNYEKKHYLIDKIKYLDGEWKDVIDILKETDSVILQLISEGSGEIIPEIKVTYKNGYKEENNIDVYTFDPVTPTSNDDTIILEIPENVNIVPIDYDIKIDMDEDTVISYGYYDKFIPSLFDVDKVKVGDMFDIRLTDNKDIKVRLVDKTGTKLIDSDNNNIDLIFEFVDIIDTKPFGSINTALNNIYNSFPSDWKGIISESIARTKLDEFQFGDNGIMDEVPEYLWLPSYAELFEKPSGTNDSEYLLLEQFEYYKNNPDKVKKYNDVPTSYYLRTVQNTVENIRHIINQDGILSSINEEASIGIAPMFGVRRESLLMRSTGTINIPYNIQDKKEIKVIDVIYKEGWGESGNNISFPSLNYDSYGNKHYTVSGAGDKIDYKLTIKLEQDPGRENRIKSFKLVDPKDGITLHSSVNGIIETWYNINETNKIIYITDIVYESINNIPLYRGTQVDPKAYQFVIPAYETGERILEIPQFDISEPNEFNIIYNDITHSSRGYTSAVTPLITTYSYGDDITISKDDFDIDAPTNSNNELIHVNYWLNTVKNDNVNIGPSSYGEKVITINWEDIEFIYNINDLYQVYYDDDTKQITKYKNNTKTLVKDIKYKLNSSEVLYTFNPIDISRDGWSIDDDRLNLSGNQLIGFRVAPDTYGHQETNIRYIPNTYTISLIDDTEIGTLEIIYDHEIEKWNPDIVPIKEGYIFNGFEDTSGQLKITYGGEYLFTDTDYKTDIDLHARWKEEYGIIYNTEDNVIITEGDEMEKITLNNTDYLRFKEEYLSPISVQSIITDILTPDIKNTKYVFDLYTNSPIDLIIFRKINDHTKLKGYTEIICDNIDLEEWVETDSLEDNYYVIELLENIWPEGSLTPEDLWFRTETNYTIRATSDLFSLMFKINENYYVFDTMIEDMSTITNNGNKQDFFLKYTDNGLKEIMEIRGKDNELIYNRKDRVIENNNILSIWEDVITEDNLPVEVHGLLPINDDHTYDMNMFAEITTKWDVPDLSNTTPIKLSYNSNTMKNNIKDDIRLTNYNRIPLGNIKGINNIIVGKNKANWNISSMNTMSLHEILGYGAYEHYALISSGDYFTPMFKYRLEVLNSGAPHKTSDISNNDLTYVYSPINRNPGVYNVRGPFVNTFDDTDKVTFEIKEDYIQKNTFDDTDKVTFEIKEDYIQKVYIGVFNSDLSRIVKLIELDRYPDTDLFILDPDAEINASDNYTIVIGTLDKLIYNNLLIYKMFNDF